MPETRPSPTQVIPLIAAAAPKWPLSAGPAGAAGKQNGMARPQPDARWPGHTFTVEAV
jgi:hypothetical protein